MLASAAAPIHAGKYMETGGFMIRLFAMLLALLTLSGPAMAQTLPPPVAVQFLGTITGSAADSLVIRNGDGTTSPWTGPLPDFPYHTGDQIAVSFTAQTDNGVQSADGLYRYTFVGPSQLGGLSGSNYAVTNGVDVTGPISGGGGISGLTLVYNAVTGSYGLELPSSSYTMWLFDGPGLLYDPASNTMALTASTRQPGGACGDFGAGCFNIVGDLDSGAVDRAPVWGTDGSLRGLFGIEWTGSWFVNGQQVVATAVPEPDQLPLFAAALLVLGWLYQRRLVKARTRRAAAD